MGLFVKSRGADSHSLYVSRHTRSDRAAATGAAQKALWSRDDNPHGRLCDLNHAFVEARRG
jgi:hypothetical protein